MKPFFMNIDIRIDLNNVLYMKMTCLKFKI